ncbi:MAG TPA: hypothetical protein VGR38_03200 [Candidatus Polarisedimenticolia bacterium]|nr:hypothetical protein [Candidatus Polarisedimenticolia bacterium]
MTKRRTLARLVFGFVVVMCCAFTGRSGAQTGGYCTQTADTLLDACKASVMDDGAVGKAICINITDAKVQNACLDDLAGSQDEAIQLCLGQHDTRLAACRVLGEGRYDPDFKPARFDNPKLPSNPNPYFPLGVGKHWEYRTATQVNTVDVVNETKLIAGVNCIVFRDLVFEGGFLHEATDDWYAPAKDGSVWYFGEETKDYEIFKGDKPVRPELDNIDGSFKAGRDGDKPGIIALAAPKVGDAYLEEFSLANAEDVTEIMSTTYSYGHDPVLDEGVPAALAQRFCAGNCIVTKNYSLLEPGLFARKYYARGVGTILEVENTGEVVQLVKCNFDSRCANLPIP